MAKYVGNSFKDWWNAHYGTAYNGTDSLSKTEGMSEEDYAIGQKLYDAYLNENKLTAAYNTSKGSLGQNKADAKRAADISYQRLQKYLPQQLAKQGLYGTGLSEDAYLKLHSNYRNEVSDIDKNYNDNITSLENAYNSDLSDLRSGVGTAVEGVMDKYRQYRIEDEARLQTQQTNAYNEASNGLQNGSYADAADVLNYVKGYEGKMSDQQYQTLKREAAAVIKASGFEVDGITGFDDVIENVNKSKIHKATASDFDSLKNGDNITVKINDEKYTVESSGKTSDTATKFALENGMDDGTMFVYGDNKDVYIYNNGAAYKVVSKFGSEPYNSQYNDVRQYLLGQGLGKNYQKWKNNQTMTKF